MLLVQSESYIRRTSLESLAEQTWFEIGSHFPDYLGAELLALGGRELCLGSHTTQMSFSFLKLPFACFLGVRSRVQSVTRWAQASPAFVSFLHNTFGRIQYTLAS